MKKIFSCIILLTLAATLALSAFAAPDSFVPSIGEKEYPELVPDSTNNIGGVIVDENGETVKEIPLGEILVTPISQAKTSELIPDSAEKMLLEQYEKLTAAGVKLSEVCSFLNQIVRSALGEGKDADDLVIREFFDVSIIGDENIAMLGQPENKIVVKLRDGLAKDEFVTGMIYKNGEWKSVKTENNGDGTVTCTFEDLCPVALLTPATAEDVKPPLTGENATLVWIVLALISLSVIVVCARVIINKRKHITAA